MMINKNCSPASLHFCAAISIFFLFFACKLLLHTLTLKVCNFLRASAEKNNAFCSSTGADLSYGRSLESAVGQFVLVDVWWIEPRHLVVKRGFMNDTQVPPMSSYRHFTCCTTDCFSFCFLILGKLFLLLLLLFILHFLFQ